MTRRDTQDGGGSADGPQDPIYRTVVEDQTEFVVRWLPDGTRTFVNHSYARYYGSTREAMVGTSFFPLIPLEAERQRVKDKVAALTPDNPVATEEHRVILPDGTWGWNLWTDRGFFDADGNLVELQSVGRDTTELHEAQLAIAQSEEKFRQAFESSPDGLAITRLRDSHLLDVNHGFERIFDISREEAIGRTSIELGLWERPEKRAELLRKIESGQAVDGFESRFVTKTGRKGINSLSTGGLFELDGERCFLTVIRDVTAAKRTEELIRQSEERYRKLVESALDGVLVVREEGIIECNERFAEMLDLPREAVIGTTPWVHSPPQQPNGRDSRTMGREILERVLAGEKLTFEWIHLRRDGSEIPFEISLSGLTIEKEPTILAVLRDISRRKEADDQLRKAYDEIRELRDQLKAEVLYLREEIDDRSDFGDLIGESRQMRSLGDQIRLVAPTDSTVLLLGESGTGKELIAREIHRHGQRSQRAMIRVNCASIPSELYESEFFGHVKGAFTGAVKDRAGRFELAHGGTIFLDEISEIPLPLQAKLLRVLQEGEYERVGDERMRETNVRVIAATNSDLEQDVRDGNFRADLYYRLNVFPLHVPSLRDRGDDILLLARHFLMLHASTLNQPVPRFTRAAAQQLMSYDWPGNVRELQNIIERAVIISRGGPLVLDLPSSGDSLPSDDDSGSHGSGFLTERQMKLFERKNLEAVLERTDWQVFGPDGAAALLGVRPTTLTSRIKKLGLRKPPVPG